VNIARLREPAALENLKQFLGQHLGTPYVARLSVPSKRFSENEKIQFLPMIFGLLPRGGALRSSVYVEVKPLIRAHLQEIGVPNNELLVDLLKELCDNFDRTQPNDPTIRRFRPRKLGMADLRQDQQLYRRILTAQNRRCAVCGVLFQGTVLETLDHIIPWRLGGDPPDGSNWQILCSPCNGGKSDLISSIALVEYFNWVYADTKDVVPDLSENRISLRSRYLALTCLAGCQLESCQSGPSSAELVIVRKAKDGFSVLDHLAVFCENHVSSVEYPMLTS
jgi:5-methylcytosine-specific restriction endonuclease McrA